MDCRRKHHRARLESQCQLIEKSGGEFPALLEDISFSGALVKVGNAAHFKTGDLCDLMLSFKAAELPIKRSCKIVRVDSEIIGVTFLD
jgi:hypothetical protein